MGNQCREGVFIKQGGSEHSTHSLRGRPSLKTYDLNLISLSFGGEKLIKRKFVKLQNIKEESFGFGTLYESSTKLEAHIETFAN